MEISHHDRTNNGGFKEIPLGWLGSRPAILASVLCAVTLAVFLPALRNGFVNLDDGDYVTGNFRVQAGITLGGASWACTSFEASNWHPLTWLSHMLDCQLFGLRAWGHHLTSVLLHALNAALLFLVLRRLTGTTWRSLAVAALFGLHPLRVESVAWIAERKDVLSAFFGLLALLAYAKYAQRRAGAEGRELRAGADLTLDPRPSTLDYPLALLCFAFSLMSKPMLVTLPGVLLLLDYWPLNRWTRAMVPALIREKVPFVLATVVVSWITFAAQKQYGAVNVNVDLAGRVANAAVSYCRYLGKLFWPVDLAVPYPYPPQWPWTVVLGAGALLAATTVTVFFMRRRFPWLLVGWLWFVGTLVPVIGIIQVGGQSMADRYTYIPSVGVALLLVWSVAEMMRGGRGQTALWTGGVAGALLVCAGLAMRQIGRWRNDETLFRHALEVTRGNYVAHFYLGAALHQRGDDDGAGAQFRQSLEMDPTFPSAHDGLGVILLKRGEVEEAIRHLEEASRRRPNEPRMHYHLGMALDRKGDADAALGEYRRALELKPDLAEAHNDLAVLSGRLGRSEDAVRHFREAARLQPGSAEFRYNLGNALARIGQHDEAIGQLLEAVRLDPEHGDAHNNLGVLLSRKGRWEEAVAQFQAVLKLKPDHAEARRNLQTALRMAGAPQKP